MNILKEYGGFLFVSEINNLQLRRNVLNLNIESLNRSHPKKREQKNYSSSEKYASDEVHIVAGR